MTRSRPLVSIGMPVRNGERYLEEAIASALAQTVDDLELIISDNASIDRTAEIAQDYAVKDDRVRYEPNDRDVGANRNYNRTFFFANGRYFKWLAADDVCAPTFLERCLDGFEADPDAVLCATGWAEIDRTGRPLRVLGRGRLDSDGDIEVGTETVEFHELARSSDVANRVRAVLFHFGYGAAAYGLGRTDAIARTRLQRPFYGSDKVYLVELALVGRTTSVPDVLWYRRTHPDASTRMRSPRERNVWAGGSGGDFYPWQMLTSLASTINDSDLSPTDKRRCLAVLGRKCADPRKWAQLVVPYRWNYFGWGAG